MIDDLIDQRANGDPIQTAALRVKLLLRGIDPDAYTQTSEDDPSIIQKLDQMAAEFGADDRAKGAYR